MAHELGHGDAALSVGWAMFKPLSFNSEALKQENLHRELLGKGNYWIRRKRHD